MERALFYLRIHPGTEAEYDRRHAEVWPELVDAIRAAGVRDFSGFRRGTDVWYYGEYEPDAATAFGLLGQQEVNARWNRYFRDVIAHITTDSGELIFYDEVFHTNAGPALEGPKSRGFLTLVIDIERSDEYEALHAEPWPDMIAAIAASGFRNYSGFRRGASVVYYGEYHPDMATVLGRMARHEVNARWGKAFEGIITTITAPDGSLITATEIYHQD